MDYINELKRFKRDIKEAENVVAESTGKISALKERLEDDYHLKSVSLAEKKIKKLEKEKETLEQEIEKEMEEIEEAMYGNN